MLFFLGLFASYLLLGSQYSKRLEEEVSLDVQVQDDAEKVFLDQLARDLSRAPYANTVTYVSKEEALKEFQDKFGEELSLSLGEEVNPLPASFRIKLWPNYIQRDSLNKIKAQLTGQVMVLSVEYPLEEILQLQQNLRVISWLMLGVGVVLLVIALYLIFGTIRLGIYGQRLAIRSMQLIGAKDAFIRRPFVLKGLLQGGISGSLACALILSAWWMLVKWSPAPLPSWHLRSPAFIGLLGGIVLLGVLLGWLGSYVAVNRYLHKNLDQLMQD